MNDERRRQRNAVVGYLDQLPSLRWPEQRWALLDYLAGEYPTTFQPLINRCHEIKVVKNVDIVHTMWTLREPLEALARLLDERHDFFDPEADLVQQLLAYVNRCSPALPANLEEKLRQFDAMEISPADLREAYQRTLMEFGPGEPAPPALTISRAAGLLVLYNSHRAMCAFLERVAYRVASHHRNQANRLRQWILAALPALPGMNHALHEEDRDRIHRESWGAREHILCRISKAGTRRSGAYFDLRIFEYEDTRTMDRPVSEAASCFESEANLRYPDVKARVGELLGDRLAAFADIDADLKRPVVEMMLPTERLAERVEGWPTQPAGSPIGALAAVVVRPVERVADSRSSAVTKWRRLLDDPTRSQAQQIFDASPTAFEEPVCVVLSADSTALRTKQLTLALAAGVPWVLWDRTGKPVNGLLTGSPLDAPDRVRIRRTADPGEPADLVLVWDNPCWVPDDAGLTWKGSEQP